MNAQWRSLDDKFTKAEAVGRMEEAIQKYQSFLHDMLEVYENSDYEVQQFLNETYSETVFKYACVLDISEMLFEVATWEEVQA
jgi:hypothetical protein